MFSDIEQLLNSCLLIAWINILNQKRHFDFVSEQPVTIILLIIIHPELYFWSETNMTIMHHHHHAQHSHHHNSHRTIAVTISLLTHTDSAKQLKRSYQGWFNELINENLILFFASMFHSWGGYFNTASVSCSASTSRPITVPQ